jgi:hypothetical protein
MKREIEYIIFHSTSQKKSFFGKRKEFDSLEKVLRFCDRKVNLNKYIMIYAKRPGRKPSYWRVFILPAKNGVGEIYACNNPKLTNRIFNVKIIDKE